MLKINLFSHYIPKIENIAFDAEFDFSVKDSSKITDYPLENGYNITNAVIHLPVKFKITLGVGDAPLNSLLTDPVDSFKNNGLSLFSGFVSNFANSGLVNYGLGLVSKNLFKSFSRGANAYELLQLVKLSSKPLDMIIHDFGVIKNVIIEKIETSRKPITGNIIFYDVSFKQIQTGHKPPSIDTSSERVNMGESKVGE